MGGSGSIPEPFEKMLEKCEKTVDKLAFFCLTGNRMPGQAKGIP